jgi:hypothetical protein
MEPIRRLSRGPRIGVMLSVHWLIGGGLWGNNLGIHEGDWIFDLYGACLTSAYNAAGVGLYAATDACARNLITRWDAWPEGEHRLVGVLVVGLIPIIVAWIFAWICIRVSRWVMRGAPS